MICALTVRTLKPGTFDEFREAFLSGMDPNSPPEGWVRFDMLRNADNPDEVITFGFFDGTADDVRRDEAEHGDQARANRGIDTQRRHQRDEIRPFDERNHLMGAMRFGQ
jgi:heme-degrading monooxygenase HmoA